MSVSSGNGLLDKAMKVSDASIARYKLVKGDQTNTTNAEPVVTVAGAETERLIGITQEATTAANQFAAIRLAGISKLQVDGNAAAIDIGDSICAGTAGVGHKSTTADAAEQWAIGYALEPSTADGDVITVLIDRHLIVKGTA
jgi:hypothetical protein